MVRDKYRIDAFIATGSMAIVYAATHRNGSRVALKILHRELARDPAMAERFRREGYFANAIGHPGVVRAIDDDVTEDGCAFIVMELLEGENLEERRERLGGRVPVAETLEIADAMLDVLAAAHDHEILHRDLKPENVFVTRKNEVKLLDFGVARFNDGRSSSEMTAAGMVLGTPSFMPPEQALGRREDVDARSDIWAVGATLFTVMSGEAVHAGGDAKSKLIATARTPARPIRDVVPDLPGAVAAVIDRALAFDKAERWADAKAMREALRWARRSLGGEERITRPDASSDSLAPETRRREEEEPTLARELKRVTSPFDETATLVPVVSMRYPPASDGVITSAPPVTRREEPPSMAASEGPTFLLRRLGAARDEDEIAPSTQRMPPQMVVPTPGAIPSSGPTAIARAAAAETAARMGAEGSPEPARAAPADSLAAPTPPMQVTPRGQSNPPQVPSPATPLVPFVAGAPPMMAANTSAPPVLGPPAPSAPSLGHTPGPPVGMAPHVAYPSHAPHALGTPRQPPVYAALPPEPERSGGGALRLLIPLFIGLAAAGGTYVFIARRPLSGWTTRAPVATSAPSPPATPAMQATGTASALQGTPSVADSAALPAPSADPKGVAASASPPPAASSAPPKKRLRPRPKPTATATATAIEPPPEPPPPTE